MAIDYIAQHIWYLTGATFKLGGIDFKGASYIELAYPEVSSRDERSADQIKEHILKRLSE